MIRFVLPVLAAGVASWAVTRIILPLLRRRKILDEPNARSSHSVPTPRGGGLGILAGIAAGLVAGWLAGLTCPPLPILFGAALIAAIGFADDGLGGLPVRWRFLGQVLAAMLVVGFLGGLPRLPLPAPLDLTLGVLAVPAAVVWILAVTNLYNFLDGIDGYAGVQGVIGGVALAAGGLAGPTGLLGLSLAGASAGFLPHNWHKAKIFMGDVGSATIGFLFATAPFAVGEDLRGVYVFLVGVALWFFLADGVFTLIRRLMRGEKIWEAHRSHLYQRLVASGLPHDRVVILIMSPAAVVAGAGVVAATQGPPLLGWCAMIVALLLFGLLLVGTSRKERLAGL